MGWKVQWAVFVVERAPHLPFLHLPPCCTGSLLSHLVPSYWPRSPQSSILEHSGTWALTFWLRHSQALYREGYICLVWPRSGFVSLQLVGKSNLIYEEGRFIAWADTWLPWLCCNKRWNCSSGGLGGLQAGLLMTVPANIQSLSEAGQGDQIALPSR